MDRPAERIESIKAVGLSLLLAGMACVVLVWFNTWLANSTVFPLLLPYVHPGVSDRGLTFLLLDSIGLLVSAALFGVTYRYVVRNNSNPHLGPGAVGAFGLVRGCAQLETGWQLQADWAPLVLAAMESCLVFAIVAAGLDWCMQQGWLQPLGSEV